jgi:glycosyltransferase involved in cell wall biosynthesis
MQLRILQVITDTDRRGAQVFALDLQRELRALGYDVDTVALAPGSLGGLDVPTLGPTRRHPSTFGALHREMRRADVVVAHGSTTLPLCALAGLATRTPFVYRQISDLRFWSPKGLRRERTRAGLRRAAAVVALWSGSAALITSEFGVASSRIAVVPNAVPAERFAPRDADERAATRTRLGLRDTFTVVYVGALAPEKGPDVAVAAVARVEDAQLLVVGDGPERATLEQQAQDEAHGRVVFTGSIADPTDAYVAADVVVLPSRGGDSMPAVLIEAGLMERASVSTPVEAIPELVVDGVTGRIVPVGSVDGLAAALTELRDDPAGTAQLGCAARARCLERYSMPVVARQWSDLLTRVANARRRSSP